MRQPSTGTSVGAMDERTLILLRHAKSDWSVEKADIDRPLAKRGRRQAPEVGRWLAAHIDSISLAVVSPAARARRQRPVLCSDNRVSYVAQGTAGERFEKWPSALYCHAQ
jgi:phosphohistidine phosphatase SixA